MSCSSSSLQCVLKSVFITTLLRSEVQILQAEDLASGGLELMDLARAKVFGQLEAIHGDVGPEGNSQQDGRGGQGRSVGEIP